MKQVHLLIEIIVFTFPLWRIRQGNPILLCLEIVWKWKELVGEDGGESATPKWCDLVKVSEFNFLLITHIENPFLFNIHWAPFY